MVVVLRLSQDKVEGWQRNERIIIEQYVRRKWWLVAGDGLSIVPSGVIARFHPTHPTFAPFTPASSDCIGGLLGTPNENFCQ